MEYNNGTGSILPFPLRSSITEFYRMDAVYLLELLAIW